jgi:hypothetical protein
VGTADGSIKHRNVAFRAEQGEIGMRKFMGLLLAAVVFGMFTTGAFAANSTGTHRHHAKRHHKQHHHQAK